MSKLLRDPATGKIRAKAGKLLTGNAGDPCCCGTCRWVALQCPVTATADYYVFIAADAPLANWCVCEGKPVDVTASVQISPAPGELGQLPAPGDRMAVDSAILSNVGGNVSIHIIAGSIDFTAGVASTEKCQCATVGTFSGFGINFDIVSGSARLTVVRSQTCPDATQEQCCGLQMIEACEAMTLRATLVGARCPGSFSLWNQTRYAHIYINDVKVDERETYETDLVWTINLAAGDRLFAVTAQSGITSLASTYRFGAYDIYFAYTGGAASPATTNALVTGASVTTSDGNIPIGAAASDKYPCQPEVVEDMTVSVDGKSFDLVAADATTADLTQTPTTKHLWTFPSPGPGEPAYKFVSGQVAPGVYYLTASRVNADGPGVTIANEPLAIWYKFACSPTAGEWIAFAVSDHLTGAPCVTDSSSPGSSSGGSSPGSSSTPGSSGGGSSSHAGSSHGSSGTGSSTGGSSGGTGGSSGGGTGSSHTGSSTGGSGSTPGSSGGTGSSGGSASSPAPCTMPAGLPNCYKLSFDYSFTRGTSVCSGHATATLTRPSEAYYTWSLQDAAFSSGTVDCYDDYDYDTGEPIRVCNPNPCPDTGILSGMAASITQWGGSPCAWRLNINAGYTYEGASFIVQEDRPTGATPVGSYPNMTNDRGDIGVLVISNIRVSDCATASSGSTGCVCDSCELAHNEYVYTSGGTVVSDGRLNITCSGGALTYAITGGPRDGETGTIVCSTGDQVTVTPTGGTAVTGVVACDAYGVSIFFEGASPMEYWHWGPGGIV